MVWEFDYSSDQHLSHHDVKPLPNGNVLVLAVEKKTYEDCLAAGFNPQMLRDRATLPRVLHRSSADPAQGRQDRLGVARLGPPDPGQRSHQGQLRRRGRAPRTDRASTATAARRPPSGTMATRSPTTPSSTRSCSVPAAATKSGSSITAPRPRRPPATPAASAARAATCSIAGATRPPTSAATSRDRQLFQQHDAQWIPQGYPGAGHILIFNNGLDRGYSTIEEIVPPMDDRGNYVLSAKAPTVPRKPVWRYQAENPEDFYSSEISGAHRLPNGNTLICAGVKGTFFEVTPAGETVWQYVNPVVHNGILAQGELSGNGPSRTQLERRVQDPSLPPRLSRPGRQRPQADRADRAARVAMREDRFPRPGAGGSAGRQGRTRKPRGGRRRASQRGGDDDRPAPPRDDRRRANGPPRR